jgi:hypothetical protein
VKSSSIASVAGHRNLAAVVSRLARPLPADVRVPRRRVDASREGDGSDLAEVLSRVGAAGHPPESASALAELWPDLAPLTRAQIAAPLRPGPDGFVRFGSRRAVQTSETTCGSAVLVSLLASGDPVVATWLMTGRRLGSLPREIAPVAGTAAASDVDGAPGARFEAAQEAMLRATSRRALGIFSWPHAFGTPPWTAARHARFPGVRYSDRAVDDADRTEMTRFTSWLLASLARGVPVPLYTGGDLVRGLSSVVPRHVVLAVAPPAGSSDGAIAVYEPTQGRVHELLAEELVARKAPHPALGNWTHLCWAVLPHAVRSPAGPAASALRLPS